jgi:ribosome-binding protein aMBF1 (putative translation factor)
MALEKSKKLPRSFGNRVKGFRTDNGLARQELANRRNIERIQLILIEDVNINTCLQMANGLAKVFGISLKELMEFDPEEWEKVIGSTFESFRRLECNRARQLY